MSNQKEIGWNPQFDEGVRLISTHSNFSGIRAALKLPTVFRCEAKAAYFNFYLGINFRKFNADAGAVEAGISYTYKPDPLGGEIRPHWRLFVNPPGNPVEIQGNLVGSVIGLELDVHHPVASLALGTWDGVAFTRAQTIVNGNASASAGFVKMVAAIHEDHGATLDRTTFFDHAMFKAVQVRKEGRTDWLNIDKIDKLFWNCERQESMHYTIHTASQTYQDFSLYMVDAHNAGTNKTYKKARVVTAAPTE